MTYLEVYRSLPTVEAIKEMAISDTKIAIFLGNNPYRIKAIEDAMNVAIKERGEHETD